jgi:hypothetical protein
MTNPPDYLTDLLNAVDLTNALDDEIVWVDPIESRAGDDVPNESGPIVYYPENDPNYDPNYDPHQPGPELPNESGPIFYDPNFPDYQPSHGDDPAGSPHGGDVVIDGCWGSGSTHETDPGEGEVSIQPVEETPIEDVYLEPDPEQEPGPVMSIQPVEETPVTFETDDVAIA